MKRAAACSALAVMAGLTCAAQSWQLQVSGTTASLRSVMAVNAQVAWASGTKGTFLRTTDGGATWKASVVRGAADMDFRAVYGFDDSSAVLLSSGPGPSSRVYRTVDGGGTWNLVYTNGDPAGSFDAIGYWDEAHGILIGDPVKGRFTVMTTADGGVSWHKEKGPAASDKETAAGGSCLFTRGTREAWFATSGNARVFHTTDGGQTWTVSKTLPLKSASSVAFSSGLRGVLVGDNVVVSEDGGKAWAAESGAAPAGPRSAVAYNAAWKIYVAVGPSGSDVSRDGGKTWMAMGSEAFTALSFTMDGDGWAVGPNGAVAKFSAK